MNALKSLSHDQLLLQLRDVITREHILEAKLVAYLGEVDARRLYLEQACPSMFHYCVHVLHFAEGVAYKRIAVARETTERDRASSEPLGADRYCVRFTINAAAHAELQELRALLRHQIPDADVGKIIERAIHALLERAGKQKRGAGSARRSPRASAARAAARPPLPLPRANRQRPIRPTLTRRNLLAGSRFRFGVRCGRGMKGGVATSLARGGHAARGTFWSFIIGCPGPAVGNIGSRILPCAAGPTINMRPSWTSAPSEWRPIGMVSETASEDARLPSPAMKPPAPGRPPKGQAEQRTT